MCLAGAPPVRPLPSARLMRLDPAGLPFIGGAVLLAVVLGVVVSWPLAVPFAALAALFTFFFRDPDRSPPPDAMVVLSPADVHVNRIPASGRVTKVSHTRGKFFPAYRDDAASANERSEIWIDHGGQAIVARQIVGILARRVVCRVQTGADVRAGDRFGVMKFGSRMDVFVPPTAEITVRVGQMVRGGETVIAVLHSS